MTDPEPWSEAAISALPAWTLVQAHHAVARRFYAAFAEAGLGPTQFGVLLALTVTPALGQGALARRVLVSPQSLGKLIASLEARGLVGRTGDPGRGRRREVRLTDAGRDALARATPGVRRVNAPEALGLTAAEATQLNHLLHRVLDATARASA